MRLFSLVSVYRTRFGGGISGSLLIFLGLIISPTYMTSGSSVAHHVSDALLRSRTSGVAANSLVEGVGEKMGWCSFLHATK